MQELCTIGTDVATQWLEAYAIPNQEAVAQKLVDQMFCQFYHPEQLHSDQGKQFESAVISIFLGSRRTGHCHILSANLWPGGMK